MKVKRFLALALVVIMVGLLAGCPAKEEKLVIFTNQKTGELQLFDLEKGNLEEPVWSFQTAEKDAGAGIKTRNHPKYGQVILNCHGQVYGEMITYPDGEVVWKTTQTAANPHSIEFIPTDEESGVVVVASSSGNALHFFADHSPHVRVKVELEDAHGVLWDPKNDCLWAVGMNVLQGYTVTKDESDEITVTAIPEKKYEIPTNYAHDLAPYYGNQDVLWVSSGYKAYHFNKVTGEFTEVLDVEDVKGIGNFYDGTIVYVVPDGVHESWTTGSVQLVTEKDGKKETKTLTGDPETIAFYKCRVFDPLYQ